jgi:UV DNA damage endonuclease
MRLGYACLTLGMPEPKMRTAQRTRWQRGLVELGPIYAYNVRYAERSIAYAVQHGLMAFRISTDLFPLLDCDRGLRRLVPPLTKLRADIARAGMHVSNHPGQFVLLSTPHDSALNNALGVLRDTGWTMQRIGASGSITIHGGGVYGERTAAGQRFMRNLKRVPAAARRLLALENDEHSWTVPELLAFSDGDVPIVFDKLHWQANPRSARFATELEGALATWPKERIPEFHYSEQAPNGPRGAHAAYISGAGLLTFLEELNEAARGREVAVIVEAKRKDLAIARAVGELRGRDRKRLLTLVPDLSRAPRNWVARSAALEPQFDAA